MLRHFSPVLGAQEELWLGQVREAVRPAAEVEAQVQSPLEGLQEESGAEKVLDQ